MKLFLASFLLFNLLFMGQSQAGSVYSRKELAQVLQRSAELDEHRLYHRSCIDLLTKVINRGVRTVQGIDLIELAFTKIPQVKFYRLPPDLQIPHWERSTAVSVCDPETGKNFVLLNDIVRRIEATSDRATDLLPGALCVHESLGALCVDDQDYEITLQLFWIAGQPVAADGTVGGSEEMWREIERRRDISRPLTTPTQPKQRNLEAKRGEREAEARDRRADSFEIARGGRDSATSGDGRNRRRTGGGSSTSVGSGGDAIEIFEKTHLLRLWLSAEDKTDLPARLATIIDCPLQIIPAAKFAEYYKAPLGSVFVPEASSAVYAPFLEWVMINADIHNQYLLNFQNRHWSIEQTVLQFNSDLWFPALRALRAIEDRNPHAPCLNE